MKINRLSDFVVGPMDAFLFDTNVWLFIFGPIAQVDSKKQKLYSSLLNEALSRKSALFITSLVLAEFANRYLRICFNLWREENELGSPSFKLDYRQTEDYQKSLEVLKGIIKDILIITIKKPDDFNSFDTQDFVDKVDVNCDFNDVYILKCCEKNNLILVSDDKDFSTVDSKVTLLTI